MDFMKKSETINSSKFSFFRKRKIIFGFYSSGVDALLTTKDILGLLQILEYIPLFGVWSVVNRPSTPVEHADGSPVSLCL
jgi:hypothetical protein